MSAAFTMALSSSAAAAAVWCRIGSWRLDVGNHSLPKRWFGVIDVFEVHAMVEECRRSRIPQAWRLFVFIRDLMRRNDVRSHECGSSDPADSWSGRRMCNV